MGEEPVDRLIRLMDNVVERLARIEENQHTTKGALQVERESRIVCYSDCNRRITSLEISRARLLGYMIGAAGGGGITGSMIANLFGA
jgi:hypothetical protein